MNITAQKHPRQARRSGFTLAEVLAALVFMAIVIPVAVQGLQIASRAGEMGIRKAAAARVANRLLNEMVVAQQSGASPRGTHQEGALTYQWQVRNEPWPMDSMRRLTINVTYSVQGSDYDLELSTLVPNSQ